MAKKDPKDYGQKYLEGIINKIPEAQREAVKAALLNEDIAADVGSNILRQQDYSTQLDALREARDELIGLKSQYDQWYIDKVTKLNEADGIRKKYEELLEQSQGGQDPPEPPKVDLSGFLKREDFEKLLAAEKARFLPEVMTSASGLADMSVGHFADYGQKLSFDELYDFARKGKYQDLRQAYFDFSNPLREKKAEEHAKKEREKFEKEIREKTIAELTANKMPFPLGSSGAVSQGTLSGLAKAGAEKPLYGRQAAIEQFMENRRRGV